MEGGWEGREVGGGREGRMEGGEGGMEGGREGGGREGGREGEMTIIHILIGVFIFIRCIS